MPPAAHVGDLDRPRVPARRRTTSCCHPALLGRNFSPTEKLAAPSALPAVRVVPVNVGHSGAKASGTKEAAARSAGCGSPARRGEHEAGRCGDGHDVVVRRVGGSSGSLSRTPNASHMDTVCSPTANLTATHHAACGFGMTFLHFLQVRASSLSKNFS